jgi:hypothetical protein
VSRPPRLRAAGLLLALAAVLAGCGDGTDETEDGVPAASEGRDDGTEEGEAGEEGEGSERVGTPQTVDCPAEATAVDLPADFPAPLPEGTVVVHVEEREDGRDVVVTGVVPRAEPEVLTELQEAYAAAGLELTEGETEERDAESNFEGTTSDGEALIGRWGIRVISDCDPEATRIDMVVRAG